MGSPAAHRWRAESVPVLSRLADACAAAVDTRAVADGSVLWQAYTVLVAGEFAGWVRRLHDDVARAYGELAVDGDPRQAQLISIRLTRIQPRGRRRPAVLGRDLGAGDPVFSALARRWPRLREDWQDAVTALEVAEGIVARHRAALLAPPVRRQAALRWGAFVEEMAIALDGAITEHLVDVFEVRDPWAAVTPAPRPTAWSW